MSTPSEDKSKRVAREGSNPKPTINFRLKLSLLDQRMIEIMNEDTGPLKDPEEMEQDSDEDDSHTEHEKTQGKFMEKFDSDDERVKDDSKSNREKESMAFKNEAEVDSDSTKATSNIDGAGERGCTKATSKDDASKQGHFTNTVSHHEASQEEEANSAQIVSDYEVSEEHIEWVDNHQHLYTVSCTRVSAFSPYCQVMVNPSWETSNLYRQKGQRGPWLHLVLEETSYKVHSQVILSKLPFLPSIYFDLTDEDEEKHRLNESLHNVNLMLYWVYHGTMPPRVEIKRANKGVGMTWDAYEIMKFARKLYAEEFMDCIHKAVALR